jgi:glycosyltransferase involved in cell wall biosynthesis
MDIGFYRYSFLNRGGDRIVIDHANYLAELGYRVTFHTCIIQTVFAIHPTIKINLLPVHNEFSFLLYPVWNQFNHDLLLFDIIHCAFFLSLRHLKKIVYLAQADDVEYYHNPLMRFSINLLYRWFFKQKSPTITVSEALTKAFTKRYNAINCHTVTNGINLQNFYPDPDPELLSKKEGRKAIFFMARGDHYRKGFDIAMKVFTTLEQSLCNKVELWICGDSFSDTSFTFPVRQFGVVDDARLRKLLSSADIFFYPSRHEGFGLFPLEAMACGCPVITTTAIPYALNIPAILSAPVGDINALTKHIDILVHDAYQHNKLRTLSLATAKQYDMKICSKNFTMTLTELIKRRVA